MTKHRVVSFVTKHRVVSFIVTKHRVVSSVVTKHRVVSSVVTKHRVVDNPLEKCAAKAVPSVNWRPIRCELRACNRVTMAFKTVERNIHLCISTYISLYNFKCISSNPIGSLSLANGQGRGKAMAGINSRFATLTEEEILYMLSPNLLMLHRRNPTAVRRRCAQRCDNENKPQRCDSENEH